MYMSFLCVFITPNNLYSEPLTIDLKVALLCEEQVSRDFCFYLFLFFFKWFLPALGQHLLIGIIDGGWQSNQFHFVLHFAEVIRIRIAAM